jgi:cob(I)alamin adenosyltransferase
MIGLIHVYAGNGKGKTTACIGLAIRTAGAGKKVAFVQFDKGFSGEEHYSERNILRQVPNIKMYITGAERINPDRSFRYGVGQQDIKEAVKGLKIAKELILKGDQFLLVLDEILGCVAYGLLEKKDVMNIIDVQKRYGKSELILSGHATWKELTEKADLVTEFRNIKHYYDKGIPARRGIEY